MMRTSTTADLPIFKKIWKDIFGDTDSFIEWFFSKRFNPDMSFIYEINGEIASVIHSYPICVNLGGKPVKAAMISGVSTLPCHRKKGLMHSLFKFALGKLDKKGYSLCYYFPANPAFYKSLGHTHITDNIAVSSEVISPSWYLFETYDINDSVNQLFRVFRSFSSGYGGGVIRQNDFETKISEYVSENLICKGITDNGGCLRSYIVYYPAENYIEICELAGEFTDISKLLSSFTLPVKVKLPPDFPVEKVFKDFHPSFGNMGGIINVQRLLSETNFDCPLVLKVTDSVFPANCGVFDFAGNPSAKVPDVTLNSGELLQTLAGYKIFPDLADFFPKLPCYSQDLY